MIYMIAAISKNNQIGLNHQMPWHLPEDLQYFRKVTTGHTVVMGRKTYESIGCLLPNRHNIILTKQTDFFLSSSDPSTPVTIIHCLDCVLHFLPKDQINFIIGGGEIYKAFLPYADRLYLTLIDKVVEGDTSFPYYEHDFKCISKVPGLTTTEDSCSFSFTIWERRS